MAPSTHEELEADFSKAVAAARADLEVGMAEFRRLRRRAIRRGRRDIAATCLGQMSNIAGAMGDWGSHVRLLKQTVKEAPFPMYFVALGRAHERCGAKRAALNAYRRALSHPAPDPKGKYNEYWAAKAQEGVARLTATKTRIDPEPQAT